MSNDACSLNNEAPENTVQDALKMSNDVYPPNINAITNVEVPNDACSLNSVD